MHNLALCHNIADTIKRLQELSTIAFNTPAFALWHASGDVSPGLVQLFPINSETPIEDRQRQAKEIARAIGGQWSRDPHDGSWRTVDGTGERFRTILHRVDFTKKGSGVSIDLSEPVAPLAIEEPREPEPNYDAPRPLTPMENWQRNDEHNVR